MNNLISIIVPIYNRAHYIKDIVTTVGNQTYANWKLIFIDDGSTDNTVEEINKVLSEKIELIKLPRHVGVSEARNKGIETAAGDYIAFLDSDDLWEPEKLEKQLKFMEENDYNFSFTGYKYEKKDKQEKNVRVPKKLIYEEALKDTVIFTSTVMINIKKIDKEIIYMPNVKFGEDSITWWKILKNGNTAYGINQVLAVYRRGEKSLSSNKFFTIKCTWKSYRKYEKLNIFKASYYFIFYIFNAIKRRI